MGWHFGHAARKGTAVIADFIAYLRCGHISQVFFNQLFCFVQSFHLSDHLFLASFVVNSVDLIEILGRAKHFLLLKVEPLACLVRAKNMAFVLYGLSYAEIRQVIVVAHSAERISATFG